MEFRVENKYLVTDADLAVIAARLKAVMKQDIHQTGDCYTIRSLYFDDINDNCLKENEDGVDQRKKYRIRIYDPKGDFIRLEIKEKQRSVTKKYSCRITREECDMIMNGTMPLAFDSRKPLNELKLQMRCAKMVPKAIIEYERTAFVHPVGNVRITFDRNISASRYCDSFFDAKPHSPVPVLPSGMHVLEVKYDEFLPDFIAKQLEISILRQTSFSKYYLGRLAVNGEFPVDR
ncbi:MAG: polyphosphate polymerase domain-containing protein [Ruminococcaceae bacterium]|nr:polyphosphate polymerase domain-containing protein [Oscillospiraceae bacterium]